MWKNLLGTLSSYFRIGLSGVRLTDSSGNLLVRNAAGNADAAVTASKLNVSGDVVEINSDAAGSGADWKLTLQRPATGMTEAVVFTLPATHGSDGQVIKTDGAGALDWASAGNTDLCRKVDTTSISHGTTAGEVTMFTLPANAIIQTIKVIVREVFNATGPIASFSVGITGTVSKFMIATAMDLYATGQYEVDPGVAAEGSSQAIIAQFVAGGTPTTGEAEILVEYSVPA